VYGTRKALSGRTITGLFAHISTLDPDQDLDSDPDPDPDPDPDLDPNQDLDPVPDPDPDPDPDLDQDLNHLCCLFAIILQPFTQSTPLRVCTISTRSACAAMTASMFL